MLLSFSVGNYRSVYTTQTLSMVADTTLTDLEGNVYNTGGYHVLKSAILYGANSSGKSNILKAFGVMKAIVRRSSKLDPDEPISPYEPFALKITSEVEPTSLEIEFVAQGQRYRYGFAYTRQEILEEALHLVSDEEETLILERGQSGTRYRLSPTDPIKEWDKSEATLYPNRLFLSLLNQIKPQGLQQIAFTYLTSYNLISGLDTDTLEGMLTSILEETGEQPLSSSISDFLGRLELGFNQLEVVRKDVRAELLGKDYPREIVDKILEKTGGQLKEIRTRHTIYDGGKPIGEKSFPKNAMESEGTKKVIELAAPLQETLRNGRLLIVDELDAKLHPLLTAAIVRLFGQDNTMGAQLIFATHDTNLLRTDLFRRDQIWFTEKNVEAETLLYALLDFDESELASIKAREQSVDQSYLLGRFGAIPSIR